MQKKRVVVRSGRIDQANRLPNESIHITVLLKWKKEVIDFISSKFCYVVNEDVLFF